MPLAGQWQHQVEETWEGGRRPEISASVPIAQQFVMSNSPVADLLRPPAWPRRPRRRPGAARAPARRRPRRRWRRAAAVRAAARRRDLRRRRREPLQPDEIEARPGQRVTDRVHQPDDMLHNIAILKPNSYDAVVKDVLAMLPDPTAQNRGYVPDSPNVLFSMTLVPANNPPCSSSPRRPSRASTRSSARSLDTGSRCGAC